MGTSKKKEEEEEKRKERQNKRIMQLVATIGYEELLFRKMGRHLFLEMHRKVQVMIGWTISQRNSFSEVADFLGFQIE